MFARALFPTDFSAYADAVLACLPDLKGIGLQEVVLLSVIRPSDVPLPETLNRQSLAYWQWYLGEKMNIARMALEGKGLRAYSRIEYGNVVETILRVAEEERVEWLILGAQGATAAQEILLGSTAYEVLRRSRLPVLLLKFEIIREFGHLRCQQVCQHLFERVLHPTDFSECAAAAFQVVKRLKATGTKQVLLIHVQDTRVMKKRSAEQLATFDQHDRQRLEAMRKTLSLYGLAVETRLMHGLPRREIIRAADDLNATLIVLGAQGINAMRELISGSTFESVIRYSRIPVLVIR
jgi:nucleotide-binding universal stress UspA family protein